jgi:hypothetical protein
MELWEIAVLLGDGITVEESKPKAPTGSPDAFRKRNLELMKARLAHEQGLGPKPEVRPMSPDVMAVFGQMG